MPGSNVLVAMGNIEKTVLRHTVLQIRLPLHGANEVYHEEISKFVERLNFILDDAFGIDTGFSSRALDQAQAMLVFWNGILSSRYPKFSNT